MALKIITTLLVICFKLTSGASYSSVLVRNGGDIIPVEYISYGAIPSPAGLSQISVDPLLSLSQVPAIVSPCVSPCVISKPQVPALAPVQNARFVTYNAPITNVPVVVTKQDQSSGYQYSYAVFDQGTGDKKSQSEKSNGTQVQGQYSFIQPDGVRREVSYTADDVNGFNAVVKNIVVNNKDDAGTKTKDTKKNSSCDDKSSRLIEQFDTEKMTMPAPTGKAVEQTTMQPSSASTKPGANDVISYSDVINCLQSKIKPNNAKSTISPLTYMLVPGLKTLC